MIAEKKNTGLTYEFKSRWQSVWNAGSSEIDVLDSIGFVFTMFILPCALVVGGVIGIFGLFLTYPSLMFVALGIVVLFFTVRSWIRAGQIRDKP